MKKCFFTPQVGTGMYYNFTQVCAIPAFISSVIQARKDLSMRTVAAVTRGHQ